MNLPTDPIPGTTFPEIWKCPKCGYSYDWLDAPWKPGEEPWCFMCDAARMEAKRAMKCPVCFELGQTSKLYPSMVVSITDVAHRPFFDEEGLYHSHNPNVQSGSWCCSRGHTGVIHYSNHCPNCDFGEPTKLVADASCTS